MKLFVSALLGLVVGATLLPRESLAAVPPGAVQLSSDKIFTTKRGGRTYTCGNLPPWSPGRKVQGYFLSLKAEIANLNKQIRSTKSATTKSRLKLKLASLKSTLVAGTAACKGGKPSGGGGTTPTPTPAPGNFDVMGNVTAQGKALFGIPSNLSGNISAGKTKSQSFCNCHGEWLNYTFTRLRTSIAMPPMNYSSTLVPDSALADITAYLNRFRP